MKDNRTVMGWGALIAPAALLTAIVLPWQAGLLHAGLGLKTFTVPMPFDVVKALSTDVDRLSAAAATSMAPATAGYAIGAVLGLTAAVVTSMVWPRGVSRVLPVLTSMQALPVIALAPLMTLYFGPGAASKAAIVVVMTFPTTLLYAARGLMQARQAELELMRSLNADRIAVFRVVRFPSAIPFIFTALKANVVLALIGTVVAEFLAGQSGLGWRIVDALQRFEVASGWAAVLALSIIGTAWYALLEIIERAAIPWHFAGR